MNTESSSPSNADSGRTEFEQKLDLVVEEYESRLGTSAECSIESLLPLEGKPFREEIAIELIRVELEWRVERGEHVSVEEFLQRFDWISDREQLCTLVNEELARRDRRRDAADGTSASLQSDSIQARALNPDDRASLPWPEPQAKVLDFTILYLLGQGAFGKVYLARQGELSERRVVLKFTHGVSMEPQWLARLQHANIVPVYSIHDWNGFQVICMPFFGRELLSDLIAGLYDRDRTVRHLSQEGTRDDAIAGDTTQAEPRLTDTASSGEDTPVPTPEKVGAESIEVKALRIFQAIVAGLAHAHAKGVMHGDLKPANILIADDGTPMILDFSLSRGRRPGDGTYRITGGTLPYMSPEQLQSLEGEASVTLSSDVYSIGVMLFQLIRGELPFGVHTDRSAESLRRLRVDREQLDVTRLASGKEVSEDLWQIVRKCLEPRPEERYATATELLEDLSCHAANRELRHARSVSWRERLRKWRKRHPRLGSVATLGMVCVLLLVLSVVGFVGAWQSQARATSMLDVRQFNAQFERTRARLSSEPLIVRDAESTYASAMELINHWRGDDDEWRPLLALSRIDNSTREEVVARVGELLFLTRALLEAQPRQFREFDAEARADELRELAETFYRVQGEEFPDVNVAPVLDETDAGQAGTIEANYLGAVSAYLKGDLPTAKLRIEHATAEHPTDFAAWFVHGNILYRLRRYSDAEACYTRCLTLQPNSEYGLLHRGLTRIEQQKWEDAEEDFLKLVEQKSLLDVATFNLALCRYQQGQSDLAIQSLDQLIESRPDHIRGLLLRGRVHESTGNSEEASQDRSRAFAAEVTQVEDSLALGVASLPDDPARAAQFFRESLVFDSKSFAGLLNLSHVQAMYLRDNMAALETLDELVKAYPSDAHANASRGVILARLERRDEALQAGELALQIDPSHDTHFQLACINSLLAESDKDRLPLAIHHLRKAAFDRSYASLAFTDDDLANLRQDPRGQETLAAIQILYRE